MSPMSIFALVVACIVGWIVVKVAWTGFKLTVYTVIGLVVIIIVIAMLSTFPHLRF